jgi:hypothetical protein
MENRRYMFAKCIGYYQNHVDDDQGDNEYVENNTGFAAVFGLRYNAENFLFIHVNG